MGINRAGVGGYLLLIKNTSRIIVKEVSEFLSEKGGYQVLFSFLYHTREVKMVIQSPQNHEDLSTISKVFDIIAYI